MSDVLVANPVWDRHGAATAGIHAMPGRNNRWYVFRAAPQREHLAEANLGRQGFHYFLPKVLVTKRHARKFLTKREWLFPRYGFVSLDVTRDRWRAINGTLGIEHLVMGMDRPQPVAHGIVESLQSSSDEYGLVDLAGVPEPGSTVRVRFGPLAGTLGLMQGLDGKGRVELLLELMSTQVRTKLDRYWIETVE